MLIRFPLEIENKKPKRRVPAWVINFVGLLLAVFVVALTYVVLAAITE